MTCDEMNERLYDKLKGLLDVAEERELIAHLEACGDCREEAGAVEQLWTRLGEFDEEVPSERMRARFYSALSAYQEETPGGLLRSLRESFYRLWPTRPALQLGLALATLVIGLLLGTRVGPSPAAEIDELREEMQSMDSTLATIIGLLAALAVVRHRFRGRQIFLALLTLPMVAPGIVLGVSLLMFARFIGFKTGFAALLLGHTLLALPYCTFIIISSLARFDRTLEDAARGLGASEARVLWRVTLPNIMPGIIGALLFGFTISIGEFVVSFFLTSPGFTTLPIRIYSIVKVGITPEINAVSSLVLAATFILTLTAVYLTWSRRSN